MSGSNLELKLMEINLETNAPVQKVEDFLGSLGYEKFEEGILEKNIVGIHYLIITHPIHNDSLLVHTSNLLDESYFSKINLIKMNIPSHKYIPLDPMRRDFNRLLDYLRKEKYLVNSEEIEYTEKDHQSLKNKES